MQARHNSRRRRGTRVLAVATIALASAVFLHLTGGIGAAQDKKTESAKPSRQPAPVVAASVDGTPIPVHLLEADLKSSLKGRNLTAAARQVLQAEILERAILRIAIIQHLQGTAQAAKPAQVDAAIDHLRKQLANQNTTLETFLDKSGLRMADLRIKLSWQICWGQYLKRFVTEDNLQRYFSKNRQQFDGTQLRVQHLLLKRKPGSSDDDSEALQKQIADIRQQIVEGKITFAEAARKYSQSPSSEKDGDIGWIARHKPMVESFSKAAFELQKGQISPPVKTPFGIHLIHCSDVRPGKKTWKDCEPALRRAIADYLFDWLGQEARKKASVRFTDAWPHFQADGKKRLEEKKEAAEAK